MSASQNCFICGESMEGYTIREITVLGALNVRACAPCVDLPDTEEFVNELLAERLGPVRPERPLMGARGWLDRGY